MDAVSGKAEKVTYHVKGRQRKGKSRDSHKLKEEDTVGHRGGAEGRGWSSPTSRKP